MVMNLKKEPMINSTTYYAASKISDRLYLLLASRRSLTDVEVAAVSIGRKFVADAITESGSTIQQDAITAVTPKLKLATGKDKELSDILKAITAELDATIEKKATDPSANKLSPVLFRELTEYYIRMRQKAESRGL
ncbi:MAG: hypothetical protein KGH66_00585 [Candidatus Micrarchaeota archaeon]|nr:hypothetical protein [Candidatus Micrarchaeota archaeon]